MESRNGWILCCLLSVASCVLSQGVPCSNSAECGGTPGTQCVADYCQPSPCLGDRQCVTGQVCSHDTTRECVYPVSLVAEEDSQFTLRFAKPAEAGATYEQIRWYKGSRANSIVYYEKTANGAKPKYFKDYCASDCDSSNRVSLNTKTGDLTILVVNLHDEDYYFYKYSASSDWEAGSKYEIKVEVKTVGGDMYLYVGIVVAVVVVLAIIIGCAILYFRYKKMKKRLRPYRPKHSAAAI